MSVPALSEYLPLRRTASEREFAELRPAEERIRALWAEWIDLCHVEAIAALKTAATSIPAASP